MDIDDKTYKEIKHLLALFYDGSIEGDDQDRLYDYFLNHKEVPKEWEVDAIIIRQLAIRRHCYKQREKLLQMMQSTPPRRGRLPLPAVVYRVAAVLLLLVGVGVALYSAWEQAPLQPTSTVTQQSRPPEALQSSTSLLAAQTTDMPVTDTPILHHHDDKPATITDNEIKNTIVQSADRHDEPILTAEQNIITDVPTQKNETASLLQKHNAIAENIDTPKPKIYCSNGCSDEYIMGLFDECVLA